MARASPSWRRVIAVLIFILVFSWLNTAITFRFTRPRGSEDFSSLSTNEATLPISPADPESPLEKWTVRSLTNRKICKRTPADTDKEENPPITGIKDNPGGYDEIQPVITQPPTEQTYNFPYTDARGWEDLVMVGYGVRVMEPPPEDISKEGSDIVMEPQNNYRYGAVDVVYRDELYNGIEILRAFGKTIKGNVVRTVTVENPGGDQSLKYGGIYEFTIDPKEGILVIHRRFKNKDQGTPVEQKTSEIIWRAWYEEITKAAANFKEKKTKIPWKREPRIKDLKYITMENVVNAETKDNIDNAFEKIRGMGLLEELKEWKWHSKTGRFYRKSNGYRFRVSAVSNNPVMQQVFNAIIGSRNGKGPARMLLDHSKALGGKQIIEIVVWKKFEAFYPSIAYRLGNLPLGYKPPKPDFEKSNARGGWGSTLRKRTSLSYISQVGKSSAISFSREVKIALDWLLKKIHNWPFASIIKARILLKCWPGISNEIDHGIQYKLGGLSRLANPNTNTRRLHARATGEGSSDPPRDPWDLSSSPLDSAMKSSEIMEYRSYEELAIDGDKIRASPPLEVDISPAGSDIIIDIENNYAIDKTDIDNLDVSDFEYLRLILLIGKTIPQNFQMYLVENPVPLRPKKNGKPSIPYAFTLSADDGIFVVNSAFKKEDAGSPQEYKFSEILFRIWYEAVQGTQGRRSIDDLKYIIMDLVINAETRMLTDHILHILERLVMPVKINNGRYSVPGYQINLSLASGNKEVQRAFSALIGCQNGKGIARMLQEHWQAFGQKEVVEIKIFKHPSLPHPFILYKVARLPRRLPNVRRSLRLRGRIDRSRPTEK
ncbi:hypothetical protein H072_6297 [Dactylellina haptotyla CBS 200.50]|uniref:Uncharacterized protein n=1 Tax=Dactylellina haptotyla (strain CBS 200.50) TaxID=1284197 RepID=S8AAF2_DACHA|nr:hypothetical protein H072_6297 [Dactylellina haptotyla CBS 200.50]